ncbi:MAG TPA: adenylate/guanylate cyclase domain-containing protein [Ramlibacter sp.]|nr:adenylate/guanylate cyclase domain-containing protein [Ramlibacter sp.]
MATVVFADLVGSTGLFERLGDETAGHFVRELMAALATTFERYRGRVVKLLGDGLLVVFPDEADAISACVAIQRHLREHPVRAGGHEPVQLQMGVEAGEVVEIGGECYGDAVNSAARLADLAGGDQILTTHTVRDALPPAHSAQLRSLGAMYLRGKSEAIEVFGVAWQDEADMDATVMGVSLFKETTGAWLELTAGRQTMRLQPRGEKLTLGRSLAASLTFKDARVSRVHAIVEWRGGHFVLSDTSSFGSWVYFGGQPEPLVLRRTECYLVGQGEIALGCERGPQGAPLVHFAVRG